MPSQDMNLSYSPPRREPDWTGMVRVVRPTLIAAIGGTGAAAAKVALSRIEHFIGPRHPFVAFRAFDTTTQDNRAPRFVDNSEYIYLGGFNAQSVIADIVAGRAFPHWKHWLPPRLNFQQVAFGAGGIRPIGRLCYFYHRERVEQAIQEALTSITDSDVALRYQHQSGIRINLEAGIDIHLVGSVCGGTGSGMFLDLAFDLRRWAEAHTNRTVTVTGHLVLPEAFRRKPVVMKALEANAYTALQELDRFMNSSSNDPWTVEYVQNRVERSWRPPFDHCYLLSGLQQGGTSDVDTLTSVIGEALGVMTLSEAGQKVSEGVINMAGQAKSTRDDQGRVCTYSSYGLLALELPEELLGQALGPALADALLQRLTQEAPLTQGSSDSPDALFVGELLSFRELLQISDLHLVERLVPDVMLDDTSVALSRGSGKRDDAARIELQRLMVEARDRLRQELRGKLQEELWRAEDMRRHVNDQVSSMLLQQRGGIDLSLAYLQACVRGLREFQQKLRLRAEEVEREAESRRARAEGVERSSLASRQWKDIEDDKGTWREHLHFSSFRSLLVEQIPRVDRLISILQQELIAPWTRIKGLLSNLPRPDSLDEDSYYRVHRARTSACPLPWFAEYKLKPSREQILEGLLVKIVEKFRDWARAERQELGATFYRLCTEAIHDYFRHNSELACDRLLAECFEYPGAKYKAEVEALLSRSKPNWELHESYAMRENLCRISCVGVRSDSRLFEAVQFHPSRLVPVEQQRSDYVPILCTEHGASLSGLKGLAAYRQSLIDSIEQEQRFDFHFFSDTRWVTHMELAGEVKGDHETFYLFSAAEMEGELRKHPGQGYVLEKNDETLGRYRREAHRELVRKTEVLDELRRILDDRAQTKDWRDRLQRQIQSLEERLQQVSDPASGLAEQYLSLDIYQMHSEIRALRNALRIEDLGL